MPIERNNWRAFYLGLSLSGKVRNSELKKLFDSQDWNVTSVTSALETAFGSAKIRAEGQSAARQIFSRGESYLCIWEDAYPSALRASFDPPQVLYCKGNTRLLGNPQLLAVVGSRSTGLHILELTRRVSVGLSELGVTIVSGLARGADTAAHEAALKGKGKTIAVLPGGVDDPVPTENRVLAEKIISTGGLLVSEMPKGAEIYKGSFPRRNRIIAGICGACLVTSASARGGALITARLAFGYGRQVFSFPGGLGEAGLVGNNLLIKRMQAMLVEGVEDIATELSINLPTIEDKSRSDLLPEELKLIDIIGSGASSLEEICAVFDKTPGHTVSLLSGLVLKDMVLIDEKQKYCIVA